MPQLELPGADAIRTRPRMSIVHLATPGPMDFEAQMQLISNKLGPQGFPSDLGWSHVIREDDIELECFHNSESFRWRDWRRLTVDPETEPLLPDEASLADDAATLLTSIEVHGSQPVFDSLSYDILTRHHAGEDQPISFRTAVNVRFSYFVDDLPIMGPGAKAFVSYGGGGQITGVRRYWRTTLPGDERQVEPADKALLRLSRAMFGLRVAATGSVTVDAINLGYYALPPRERQTMLLPVHEVCGIVTSFAPPGRHDPGAPPAEPIYYEFRRYVLAVPLTDAESLEIQDSIASDSDIL